MYCVPGPVPFGVANNRDPVQFVLNYDFELIGSGSLMMIPVTVYLSYGVLDYSSTTCVSATGRVRYRYHRRVPAVEQEYNTGIHY